MPGHHVRLRRSIEMLKSQRGRRSRVVLLVAPLIHAPVRPHAVTSSFDSHFEALRLSLRSAFCEQWSKDWPVISSNSRGRSGFPPDKWPEKSSEQLLKVFSRSSNLFSACRARRRISSYRRRNPCQRSAPTSDPERSSHTVPLATLAAGAPSPLFRFCPPEKKKSLLPSRAPLFWPLEQCAEGRRERPSQPSP